MTRYKTSKNIYLAISLIFSVLPMFAYANIIDATHGAGAGSFELGTFVNNGSDFMSLGVGNTTIVGWTVGGPGNGIDWLTTPRFAASDGIHSIDLQHTVPSSISTAIPTILGVTYEISFDAAAAPNGAQIALSGFVSAGSLVNQAFTATPSSNFDTQAFTTFIFQFTATGTSTTVTLQSGSLTNAYGPVVDNVSVELLDSVPEASSVVLFSIAIISLFTYRRKQLV